MPQETPNFTEKKGNKISTMIVIEDLRNENDDEDDEKFLEQL